MQPTALLLLIVCATRSSLALELPPPTAVPRCSSTAVTRRAALAGGVALTGGQLCMLGAAVAAEEETIVSVPASVDAAAPEIAAPVEPPAPAPAPAPVGPSAFDFDVPFRGEPRDIEPFMGKASVFVNVKFDDPISLDQMPGLVDLHSQFSKDGLHVLAFPTDQGWFEAEDSNTLRLQFKSVFGFGQYPSAVVFDKADLLGGNALPLYTWLTKTLVNPWGVTRIVFNYEKFLLDGSGRPLRRYPRKFPISLMAEDVKAALAGEPLPPPSAKLVQSWEDAKREAIKSEYAFKPGLNYYKVGSPAS